CVVPEPMKKSKTISFSSVDISKTRLISCSGFGVRKSASPSNKDLREFLATSLVDTSEANQIVSTVNPRSFAFKYVFTLGTPFPSLPNQILLSLIASCITSLVYNQLLPLGS